MPWSPPIFSGGVLWQDAPVVATALDAANLNREENAEAAYAVAIGASVVGFLQGSSSSQLTEVDATSAVPYNAAPGQVVNMDLGPGNGIVLLPTAPPSGTPDGAILAAPGTDPNTQGPAVLSVLCGPGDTFGDGSTTAVLTMPGQMVTWLYGADNNIWVVDSAYNPLASLDARYLPTTSPVAIGTVTAAGFSIPPDGVKVTQETTILGTLDAPGPPGFSGTNPGDTYIPWGAVYRWTGTGWTGPSVVSPPVVVTQAADTQTASGFTMHGSINAIGVATTYEFQVGTDGVTYGTNFPGSPASAGSGTLPVQYSQAATGLSPGTPYHYRLAAFAGGIWYYGADQTFTTLATAPVPTVTTNAPTLGSQTTETLNGHVNCNGAVGVTYQFEYGLTTGYGTPVGSPAAISGTTSVAVSAALTGLTASTLYHYRLNATLGVTTYNGADQTFTTPAPALAPTVVTGAATGVTTTTATISGTANPNGAATTVNFDWALGVQAPTNIPPPPVIT